MWGLGSSRPYEGALCPSAVAECLRSYYGRMRLSLGGCCFQTNLVEKARGSADGRSADDRSSHCDLKDSGGVRYPGSVWNVHS